MPGEDSNCHNLQLQKMRCGRVVGTRPTESGSQQISGVEYGVQTLRTDGVSGGGYKVGPVNRKMSAWWGQFWQRCKKSEGIIHFFC